ncbi:MAG: anthranilate phosphoribosyltransferase [Nitrososphaera sp.]
MKAPADLRAVIRKLVARSNLSDHEVAEAVDAILEGSAGDAQLAAFLVALSMKGETADEIKGVLEAIRRHATRIAPAVSRPIIDTCGTGGDSIRSFNISTAAAIVASAAGACVAKHGNRSVSGLCGSADFLEYVGLDLDASPAKVQSCIESVGIGFLFAPKFHPAMKNVANVRKMLGIRTVFNMVGPLSNPCTNLSGQVIGVFEPSLLEVFAEVCQGYVKEAMIVHAADGFDELSNTCENDVLWLTGDGQTKRLRLHPRVLGVSVGKPEHLVVSSKEDSIRSTLQAIYGKAPAEKQDIVVLNAAAALVVAKVCPGLKQGVSTARDAITSGKAREKLQSLIRFCGNEGRLEEAEKKFL